VGDGVGALRAAVDLNTQGASIGATTLYAVPASGQGQYRISWVATITRAASGGSPSCTLGPFQIAYTDADTNVAKTQVALAGRTSSTTNNVATAISGAFVCNAKASTNITYTMGYTSAGTTSMQYNLHIRIESLG
jgi:hypothetical protein